MKKIYSVNEAMSTIGVGRATLYRLIGDNKLTAYKIGNKTVLKADDIDNYLDGLPAAKIASDYSRGAK